MNVTNTKLLYVMKSFDAMSKKGLDIKFSGSILADGDFHTHVQGVAAFKDFHLITHSDHARKSGRILIVDRKPTVQALVGEFSLPVVSATPPFYYHAGGCQLIGDCLVVPAETGTGKSSVMLLDVSDPMNIREVDPALRISRANDAGAVGMTNLDQSGQEVWWLAAYDNGSVDFYRSSDPTLSAFELKFTVVLKETEHQSFCLLTDTLNRVFAVGLNKTFTGDDRAVLYQIDPINGTATVVGERKLDTKGGARLRWGASLDIVSDTDIILYCTSKHYDSGCHVNGFAPPGESGRRAVRRSPAKRRVKKSASRPTKRAAKRIPRRP